MTPAQRWDDDMMDFDHWLEYGMEQGFCGPIVCSTHDGIPMTDVEEEALWDRGEPCVHVIRPYLNGAHGAAVEEYHSPSNWRKLR